MIKFTFLAIIISGFFVLASPAIAVDGCRSEQGGFCVSLASLTNAQVIKGVEFLGENTSLGDVISSVYKFLLGAVALAALIMLVLGGVRYMTAGDNESAVKQAREWIGNAIFGLAVALLSWLILSTINPDLVKRLEFKLPSVKKPATLPREKYGEPGPLPPGPTEATAEGTCDQYHKFIKGKCYPYVTKPPCNPPEFYNYNIPAFSKNTCSLKRELIQQK